MAKCIECEKKGLFLKVNSDGRCKPCEDSIKTIELAETKRREDEAAAKIQAELERMKQEDDERRQAEWREQFYKELSEYKAIFDNIPSVEVHISETKAPRLDYEQTMLVFGLVKFANITIKTPRDKLGDFVAVDAETTGLGSGSSEIIEIAAIRFRNYEPVSKFVSLCKPSKKISSEITKLTGITNEKVKDSPHFRRIAHSLLDFIYDDNLVGHNLQFDLKFLIAHGVDITSRKRKYYDTLAIAQNTLKKNRDVENHKLGTLCKYYGIPHRVGHRAEVDSYAAGILLSKLEHDRR